MNSNPTPSDFVAYVGPPELHDGRILEIHRDQDRVLVRIQGSEGRPVSLEFLGVSELADKQAQGMLLYAVSELLAAAPLRRFVFSNWDEESPASLEILARELRIIS